MARKLVIDSSVIVKWLNKNQEINIEQADKIMEDVHKGRVVLFAPELAKLEIGKVLLLGKKLSQSEAKIPLALLFDLPIQFVAHTQQLSKESYAIASAYKINYNESVFLALSEQKDAVLVMDKVNEAALATGAKIIALKDY